MGWHGSGPAVISFRCLDQAELGERIGVTRQTVAAIEQGRYSPTLETAFRIADVFGVRLDEASGWEEEGSDSAWLVAKYSQENSISFR
jgi:putative transcriptional regulator